MATLTVAREKLGNDIRFKLTTRQIEETIAKDG